VSADKGKAKTAVADNDADNNDDDDNEAMQSANEDEDRTKQLSQKKKRDTHPPLNRPIILVCNDGYARALKPMIDIVIRLKVPSAHKIRIKQRVQHILKSEGYLSYSQELVENIIN